MTMPINNLTTVNRLTPEEIEENKRFRIDVMRWEAREAKRWLKYCVGTYGAETVQNFIDLVCIDDTKAGEAGCDTFDVETAIWAEMFEKVKNTEKVDIFFGAARLDYARTLTTYGNKNDIPCAEAFLNNLVLPDKYRTNPPEFDFDAVDRMFTNEVNQLKEALFNYRHTMEVLSHA